MTAYLPILQEHVTERTYDFVSLFDTDGVLTIRIIDAARNELNIVTDSYLVYRKMDEGDALVALKEIREAGVSARFFYCIENSKFLSWFEESGFGVRTGQSLFHYMICLTDDVIELISTEQLIVQHGQACP